MNTLELILSAPRDVKLAAALSIMMCASGLAAVGFSVEGLVNHGPNLGSPMTKAGMCGALSFATYRIGRHLKL